MSTPPSSFAWRRVSAQLACPAARSASTARRPSSPASEPGRGRRDPVGPERVEGPVLEEDVDRLTERRGAGGQHGRRLQLVIGPGEEDEVQGLIHTVFTSELKGSGGGNGRVARSAGDRAALAGHRPRRVRRRSRTARITPQATMTSGSAKPVADLATIALRLDDAGPAEHRQVLRDVRLARTDGTGQPADFDRSRRKCMEDLEASGAGERLEDLGLEDCDLVHGPTIDICAGADECRRAPRRVPRATSARRRGSPWILGRCHLARPSWVALP